MLISITTGVDKQMFARGFRMPNDHRAIPDNKNQHNPCQLKIQKHIPFDYKVLRLSGAAETNSA
jgi:hypothetical protein